MNATCQNLAYQIGDLPKWQCDFKHENLKIFKSMHTHNTIQVYCEEEFITNYNATTKKKAFEDDTCYLNLIYVNVWLFQKETQFLYFDASKQISN